MPWPDHPLSLDEWDALPEDTTHRYELAEGVMQVSPRPTPKHQRVLRRLANALEGQLPSRYEALAEVEVSLFGAELATVRIPDIVVAPRSVADSEVARCTAADVLLAVEIISPGSARTDRIVKLAEYADAGIAHYWIVDLDKPATITAYLLVDGDYELVAEATDKLTLAEPVPLDIDVSALLP